jgi:hypothetical protein
LSDRWFRRIVSAHVDVVPCIHIPVVVIFIAESATFHRIKNTTTHLDDYMKEKIETVLKKNQCWMGWSRTCVVTAATARTRLPGSKAEKRSKEPEWWAPETTAMKDGV